MQAAPPPDPPSRAARLGGADPSGPLHAWLADTRVDDAARARARQRWLDRQAAEGADLGGALLDLAERGTAVTLTTAAGYRIAGSVLALGADFVAVDDERRGRHLVPLAAVAMVRTAAGNPLPTGDRPGERATALGEVLSELSAERPLVVVAAAGQELRGDLVSCGIDHLTVVADSGGRDRVHVALAALDRIIITAR